MATTQAWELLNNPDHCGRLTANQFHSLLLRAGYSRDVADEEACKRGWDRLSAGELM